VYILNLPQEKAQCIF